MKQKEIKTRRKKAGLTQKDLCKLADLHQSNFSKIERGLISPTLKTLTKIEQVINKFKKTKI